MIKNLPVMQIACNAGFDPLVGKFLWRRKWQPPVVLIPGKFYERSLAGYSPKGSNDPDMTERINHHYRNSRVTLK